MNTVAKCIIRKKEVFKENPNTPLLTRLTVDITDGIITVGNKIKIPSKEGFSTVKIYDVLLNGDKVVSVSKGDLCDILVGSQYFPYIVENQKSMCFKHEDTKEFKISKSPAQ